MSVPMIKAQMIEKSLGSFLSEDTISKAIILFSTLLCFVPFSEILIGFISNPNCPNWFEAI